MLSKCIILCDDKRIVAVEDAQFKSAITGSTKAQETFLFNRAPNKWKRGEPGIHVGVQVSQSQGVYTSPVKQLKDEELNAIINRIKS